MQYISRQFSIVTSFAYKNVTIHRWDDVILLHLNDIVIFFYTSIGYHTKTLIVYKGAKLSSYTSLTQHYSLVIIQFYFADTNVNIWISNGGLDNQEIQLWLVYRTQQLRWTQLLLSTFWHCLHCFDPLLSFFSSSCLKEVVSLIWGDDLKEVAVNVVFFGWNQ